MPLKPNTAQAEREVKKGEKEAGLVDLRRHRQEDGGQPGLPSKTLFQKKKILKQMNKKGE